MTWKRKQPGWYHCKGGFAVGHIEKSIAGFWWWLVSNEKGIQQGAGRCINLKQAKKEADVAIRRCKLKVV